MANRKLFTGPNPGKIIRTTSPLPTNPYKNVGTSKNPSFKAQIGAAVTQQVAQAMPKVQKAAANYAAGVAANAIDQMMSGAKTKTSSGNKNPPRGGDIVFHGSPKISETNVNYALSKAPNPKDIHLNSGIKTNAFSNDFMNPIEGGCSPLHMTAISMAIPTSATVPLSSYFTNTICFDIQTRAQANVGFGLDITNKLSTSQLTTAFNAAIYALQIYFYYSSILSYESNSRNKNAGMIWLRGTIDAQTLSDLTQLGRRLEDVAIPPRVVEWVRYMNGNFLSADTQGAPLIKTCFSQTMLKGSVISPTYPALALSGLSSDANNTVFSLLRNTIPQWRIGILYDCNPLPTFDQNFLSIFANLPTTNFQVATLAAGNSVANNQTAVPYNSYCNNLDGLAFAMGGLYNSTTTDFIPGIISSATVNATNRDNRMSYYSVSGVKAFYNVYGYNFLALSRQETNSYLGATLYQPHLYGTDKLQNVTGEALLQSGQNVLDYLFNINSIPIKGKLSHFNRGSKQVGRI